VAGENVISKAALFSRVPVGEEFFRDPAEWIVASMKTIWKSRYTRWLQPGFADLDV
jgi:hypothetical protein